MAEFIIVFREVLEASLVVGIIYLIIEKTNQTSHFAKLWYAVFVSILASIFVGFLVIQAKNSLGNDSTQASYPFSEGCTQSTDRPVTSEENPVFSELIDAMIDSGSEGLIIPSRLGPGNDA